MTFTSTQDYNKMFVFFKEFYFYTFTNTKKICEEKTTNFYIINIPRFN